MEYQNLVDTTESSASLSAQESLGSRDLFSTGVSALSKHSFSENSYKILFWEFEIFMPGFEEISDQGFQEKYVKNLKTFRTIFKI